MTDHDALPSICRVTQNPPCASTCGFKSRPRHQKKCLFDGHLAARRLSTPFDRPACPARRNAYQAVRCHGACYLRGGKMKTFQCLDRGETFEEPSRDTMAITSTRA